jgi:drug/metabolite transporter (DMT)-like permease
MFFSTTEARRQSARFLHQFPHQFLPSFHWPKGVHLIVLSAAIYGIGIVLSKGGIERIPPLTFLTIQTASSVGLFWGIVRHKKITISLNRQTLGLALAGLLEPGLSYLLGLLGLLLTTASQNSILSSLEPLTTIGLSWLLLRERISQGMLGLGGLACLGLMLVVLPGAESVAGADGAAGAIGLGAFGGVFGGALGWLGSGLTLLGVVLASLYAIVTGRAVTQGLPPAAIAALQQSTALILFVILTAIAWSQGWETLQWNWDTWVGLAIAVVSGALGYGLAFLLYLAATQYQSASRLSIYLTLIPVFGIMSAYLLLGERIVPIQGLGSMLVLSAMMGITQLPEEA